MIYYLWPAIIEVINISSTLGGPIPHSRLHDLAAEALELWHDINVTGRSRNDAFFALQKAKTKPRSESYLVVASIVKESAEAYMHRVDPTVNHSLEALSWFAVHDDGDYHGMHTHTGDAVVAVLYLRVGNLSGNLMIHDPRGHTPPFCHNRTYHVREGELWLMPSWLPHSVLPTRKSHREDYRIILAFNFFGTNQDASNFEL